MTDHDLPRPIPKPKPRPKEANNTCLTVPEVNAIRDKIIPDRWDVPGLIATIDGLREKNHQMLEVLTQMEWVCPYCRAISPRHHKPDQNYDHQAGHREGCKLKGVLQ